MRVRSATAICLYLTGWATLVIERKRVLDIAGFAVRANREIQLIVIGDGLKQAPGPFKTQLGVFMQQDVGLERTADPMPEFDVGSRPAWGYCIIDINV